MCKRYIILKTKNIKGKNMSELFRIGLVGIYNEPTYLIIIGYIAVVIAGYLLGSLNAGIIISKIAYNDDIRKHGSGGAGATNMLRTYGKPAALATFLCDGAKTVIAVLIGMMVFGNDIGRVFIFAGPYVGGFTAILGHAFPVYYKFKVGKSVAAAFFMVICTAPLVALICFAIFVLIVWFTKYVSLGSVMSVMIYPFVLHRLTDIGNHIYFAMVIMFLVVFLHRKNIGRVMAGTENKINLSRKKDKHDKNGTNGKAGKNGQKEEIDITEETGEE
jgi:glycerol-3-phosphate acyltransferase PlsY